jgi:exonuclease III
VNKGAIIALQETHAVEEKHLITYWKHKYIMNCKSNDQKGVILLFNKDFNVITQYCDDNDRTIIAKIVNENTSIIISNLYCPNNHRESIDMLEKVYEKILELFYESPESYIIIAGDMNFCMSDNDSTNRNQSKQEAEVVRNVLNNNKML